MAQTRYPQLRPPATLHSTTLEYDMADHRIFLRHPAYSTEESLLFSLYAWDHPDGGLYHAVAHNACAIIAGNRTDGYLTATRDGPQISTAMDGILFPGDYFFHVPSPSNDFLHSSQNPSSGAHHKWPVVPTFQDWQFPSLLPPGWISTARPRIPDRIAAQSVISTAVRNRDISCRISSHRTGTNTAHICPSHEQAWFLLNAMQRWNTDTTLDASHLIHDMSNYILLRADLHQAFDDRTLIFFPKGDNSYVVHMLQPTPDIGKLYHNMCLQPIEECSPQMLYARFAWAIFPLLSSFLSMPSTARLVSVVEMREQTKERVVKELSMTQLTAKAESSRSTNQKKRQRPAGPENSDFDNIAEWNPKRQKFEYVRERNIEFGSPDDYSLTREASKSPSSTHEKLKTALQENDSFQDTPTSSSNDVIHRDQKLRLLRQKGVSRQRPKGFIPAKAGKWDPEFETNPRKMYEAYGYEIVDDLSDHDDWVGKDGT